MGTRRIVLVGDAAELVKALSALTASGVTFYMEPETLTDSQRFAFDSFIKMNEEKKRGPSV